jgi:hypothetical protein
MGIARHLGISIGTVVLAVATTVTPAAADEPPPDRTALILCGTTCPTADAAILKATMDQFITPTHPGQSITPVAVTAPQESWPITGLLRLIELAVGDPRLGAPGGAAWPAQPWWKLSGLVGLTLDQSIKAGVADLEAAMTVHGNDHLVITGYSQGAAIANMEKARLAEQYPGTNAPDIDFVLGGDVNVPNGGLFARFPGLYIPILDWYFNGPEPTNTRFHTDVIIRQYDGFADFPLYPLNIVADLNAVLGAAYVHTWPFAFSLPANPTTSPAYQGTHGDTSYYFFNTEDLPLFGPLRSLGVPERLIDVVEPFFRVIVEAGYDRTIKPWEPTPARLIPAINPGRFATDLTDAVQEGLHNARHLVSPPPPSAKGHASLRRVTASPRPTRDGPRSQAISPSHGSGHDGRGMSARHR